MREDDVLIYDDVYPFAITAEDESINANFVVVLAVDVNGCRKIEKWKSQPRALLRRVS